MKKLIVLLIARSLLSCSSNSTDKTEKISVITDTVKSVSANSDSENVSNEKASEEAEIEKEIQDTIILEKDMSRLNENSIYGLLIPFKRIEMLDQIKTAFSGYEITKEMGQQDGPDFPLYSVKKGNNEILFFSMDWEDTLKLNEVYIKSSEVADEYGLKVGDGYQDIKSKRNKPIKTFTNYHQHTYAYTDSSNIMYEISGDVFLPDTIDFENLKFTEEQIKDWTIEYVIWRK